MSVAGKLVLLAASLVVVLLVVVYGGGPAVTPPGTPAVSPDVIPLGDSGRVVQATRATPVPAVSPPAVSMSPGPRVAATIVPKAAPSPPAITSAPPRTAAVIPRKPVAAPTSTSDAIVMGQPLPPSVRPAQTPPPTPVAAPASPQAATVTVRRGDTLSAIAQRTLGRANDWPRFMDANPSLADPGALRVGQVLAIPGRASAETPAPPSAPEATGRTHRVQNGDTLTTIAEEYYGNAGKWKAIYEANRSTMTGGPGTLRIDVVLVIP